MTPRRRYLSWTWPLLLGGCFLPQGSVTTESSTGGQTSTSTSTSTDPTTGQTGTAAAATIDPTTTTSTTDTTTATDTAATGTTVGSGCSVCEVPRPYCVDGSCVGCEEMQAKGISCEMKDPDTPICDTSTGECVGCTAHADCPGAACELDARTCFPTAGLGTSVVWANFQSGLDAGVCATKETACKTVAFALGAALPLPTDHVVVRMIGGVADDQPLILIDGTGVDGHRIAVLGEQFAAWTLPGIDPIVTLGGPDPDPTLTTKLYLADIDISGQSTAALRCTRSALLWLDGVDIQNFSGGIAIHATACAATVRRSRLLENLSAVRLDDMSAVRLENSFIASMASGTAIVMNGQTQLDIVFSTVTSRANILDSLLVCGPAAAISIRNSAIVTSTPQDPITCPVKATFVNSVTSSAELFIQQDTNRFVMPADAPVLFKNWEFNDLHVNVLTPDNALQDVARWQPGDPTIDIDGAPRPATQNAVDHAGADHP